MKINYEYNKIILSDFQTGVKNGSWAAFFKYRIFTNTYENCDADWRKSSVRASHAHGSDFAPRNINMEDDIHQLTSKIINRQLSQSELKKLGQGMTNENVSLVSLLFLQTI